MLCVITKDWINMNLHTVYIICYISTQNMFNENVLKNTKFSKTYFCIFYNFKISSYFSILMALPFFFCIITLIFVLCFFRKLFLNQILIPRYILFSIVFTSIICYFGYTNADNLKTLFFTAYNKS